jgi:hypothetical protein
MGSIDLRKFPGTPNWLKVARYISDGEGVPSIAAATLEAAQRGFATASKDPTLLHAVWLLANLPQAAQKNQLTEYLHALNNLGVNPDNPASLLSFTSAFQEALDSVAKSHRTDIGELGQLAAGQSLIKLISEKSGGLFGRSAESIQQAVRDLSKKEGFGVLMREYTANFLHRYLKYFLSMELSNHVGGERRFSNIKEHGEFNKALDQHCHQVSYIVEDYAGGWYVKNLQEGGISPAEIRDFWGYALTKVKRQINRGKNGHGK